MPSGDVCFDVIFSLKSRVLIDLSRWVGYLFIFVKGKVASEWQEQMTRLGIEIEHRNYCVIDTKKPSPPT